MTVEAEIRRLQSMEELTEALVEIFGRLELRKAA